jgi:hypothetical protein
MLKKTLIAAAVPCAFIASLASASPMAPGVVYTDATGDIASGIATGNGTLDLVSMEVSSTATDVIFKLTINGNVGAPPTYEGGTDWGKFMIGISTGAGDTSANGNGWGRPINMTSNGGMTRWVGSWVDGGGGAEVYAFGSGAWNRTGATWDGGAPFPGSLAIAAGAQSTLTYTVSMASLGVSNGSTIYFDAYSSGGGGGDSAVDALSRSDASISNWGGPFTTAGIAAGTSASTAGGAFAYTIPAPGALALLGAASLVGSRRRR